MVEVKYIGRLGNKLFTYAASRIIAEEMGYKLCANPIEGFDGTMDIVDGESHSDPVQWVRPGHNTKVSEIIADKSPRKIIIGEYMQRYEHLKNKTKEIRQWYRLPKTDSDDNSVFISVRLGDYIKLGWSIALDYYTKILDERFEGKQVFVATDEPNSPHLSVFNKYNPKILRCGALEQFRLLSSAKNLIIGTSTFSWWAAFLSNATVFAPTLKRGFYFNHRDRNENYMVQEDRYTYIKDVE